MQKRRSIRLKRLQGELGDMLYEFSKVSFSHSFSSTGWRPAINAYAYEDALKICVDLAGVDTQSIEIRVDRSRLILRGNRPLPEPSKQRPCRRILVMEIDYGPFERIIELPAVVNPDRVSARQSEGFLWITLPLREEG